MFWPFRNHKKCPPRASPRTKVVLEIPDALDPAIADQKYVIPLQRLLADRSAGIVIDVAQGLPNTADEFTRIITLELSDLDLGLEIVGDFLGDNGAPAGTMTHVYDADGRVVDHYMLKP
jgi:hypothetical protein